MHIPQYYSSCDELELSRNPDCVTRFLAIHNSVQEAAHQMMWRLPLRKSHAQLQNSIGAVVSDGLGMRPGTVK